MDTGDGVFFGTDALTGSLTVASKGTIVRKTRGPSWQSASGDPSGVWASQSSTPHTFSSSPRPKSNQLPILSYSSSDIPGNSHGVSEVVCRSASHVARVTESDDTRLSKETRELEVSSVGELGEVEDGFSANTM